MTDELPVSRLVLSPRTWDHGPALTCSSRRRACLYSRSLVWRTSRSISRHRRSAASMPPRLRGTAAEFSVHQLRCAGAVTPTRESARQVSGRLQHGHHCI